MKKEDRWEMRNVPIRSPGMAGYERSAIDPLLANHQHIFERLQDLEAVVDNLGGLAELSKIGR